MGDASRTACAGSGTTGSRSVAGGRLGRNGGRERSGRVPRAHGGERRRRAVVVAQHLRKRDVSGREIDRQPRARSRRPGATPGGRRDRRADRSSGPATGSIGRRARTRRRRCTRPRARRASASRRAASAAHRRPLADSRGFGCHRGRSCALDTDLPGAAPRVQSLSGPVRPRPSPQPRPLSPLRGSRHALGRADADELERRGVRDADGLDPGEPGARLVEVPRIAPSRPPRARSSGGRIGSLSPFRRVK